MTLWSVWWEAILLLRPAFSRRLTFMWFVSLAAGLTIRTELLGVTSVVRALKLNPKYYQSLLNVCHSTGVKLKKLTIQWLKLALKIMQPLVVNGRLVLLGDGLKIPKAGKQMPGVKRLHQESESNTKPEYIMGHSLQAVSLVCHALATFFAVPLTARIHEGVVLGPEDAGTLLDKMLRLVGSLELEQAFYFVADAYYASGKIIKGLLAQGNHLISRLRSNAVAYQLPTPTTGKRGRGRPRKYGERITLSSLAEDRNSMQVAISPIYGEDRGKKKITIRYRVCDLVWKPAGVLVRFVAVCHPVRGIILLLCTDLTLDAIQIIRLYGLRFKIEYGFKQAVRTLGAFAYHFWMRNLEPLQRRSGDQHVIGPMDENREDVIRKVHAYHVFIQAGIICQGLLQYLSVTYTAQVWGCFRSWLRTKRPGIPPSEFVVAEAMRTTFPEFLLVGAKRVFLAKFLVKRQDQSRMGHLGMAA